MIKGSIQEEDIIINIYIPNIREGNCNQLQYSYQENSMDGGAWQVAVHGVAKSYTRLSDYSFTFHFHALKKEMVTHSSVLSWRIPGTGEGKEVLVLAKLNVQVVGMVLWLQERGWTSLIKMKTQSGNCVRNKCLEKIESCFLPKNKVAKNDLSHKRIFSLMKGKHNLKTENRGTEWGK